MNTSNRFEAPIKMKDNKKNASTNSKNGTTMPAKNWANIEWYYLVMRAEWWFTWRVIAATRTYYRDWLKAGNLRTHVLELCAQSIRMDDLSGQKSGKSWATNTITHTLVSHAGVWAASAPIRRTANSGRMDCQALGLPSSRRIYLLFLEQRLYGSNHLRAEIFVLFVLRLLKLVRVVCVCSCERTKSLFE